MDGTLTVLAPVEKRVAFLSPAQVSAYGSCEIACQSLSVDAIAGPGILLDGTVGQLPWFLEIGHG